jgi:hypothetical protein
VDELTRLYYAEQGPEVGARYAVAESGVRQYFGPAFLPGSRILDLGAGVGRDLAAW